ncbi:MAG: nodulation protein NfeD [Candidatus Marinimicrobia bacterium]|nr:nodulation protein NfeD [Candidatus Neomarinimicrobiota bacterium]
MKQTLITTLFSIACLLSSVIAANVNPPQQKEIWVLEYDGVINPVAAAYIGDNIDAAEKTGAECLILKMDTPGGLMTSMRDIIKMILNSEVPVAVYISPRGAQSASAGVFITVSAHFAAMAPGTNIGAAHPVNMGGGRNPFSGEKPDTSDTKTMMEKVTNDAVAQIRSLARERGRNMEWVEDAVRNSVSITETEAVDLGIVDLIASDLDELIEYLDGKVVKLPEGEKTLATHHARIMERPLGFHRKVLNIISDTNIAYLLMILGFYGLFFEIRSPGAIFPGVLGGIFLVLAFFAFQILPINYAGLALIIIAIILFIMEVSITSFGLLTIGGLISMILGSMMLFDVSGVPKELYSVSLAVIIPVVIFTVLFFVIALSYAFKAQKNKPRTGMEGIIGETGRAITDIGNSGTVEVHGEIWKATAVLPIPKDAQITVKSVNHMLLTVEEFKS